MGGKTTTAKFLGATRGIVACAAAMVATAGWAGPAASTSDGVETLVRRFLDAQRDRDVATLRALTLPTYKEVSPIGEVDDRDAMLGFYAPRADKASPRIDLSEINVRRIGGAAVAIVRLDVALPPPRPRRSMRVTYVAEHRDGRWLLGAVQYTAITAPVPSVGAGATPK